MLPILLGLGAIGGLVGLAIKRATGPSRTPFYEKERLKKLKARTVLTLDEAEDGLVLARRYGDRSAEIKFAIEVRKLKKKRVPI